VGFPHSDIFGSKVARHLPEAYRRHATSFIAFSSQGIHHTPFKFPIRKSKNRLFTTYCPKRTVGVYYIYLHWYPLYPDPEHRELSRHILAEYADFIILCSLSISRLYFIYDMRLSNGQSCGMVETLKPQPDKEKTASLSGYVVRSISGVCYCRDIKGFSLVNIR